MFADICLPPLSYSVIPFESNTSIVTFAVDVVDLRLFQCTVVVISIEMCQFDFAVAILLKPVGLPSESK